MRRRVGMIALAAAACLAAACTRTAPPAPVAHYGLQTREDMRRLVVAKTHTPPAAPRPVAEKAVPNVVARYTAPPDAPVYHQPTPQVAFAPPGRFHWPVQGRVVSTYGPKADGLYNDGINIAAPRGTPVAAAADGVVAYVGNSLGSYGNLVLIRHGGGMMTAYAHLDAVHVREGMSVSKGGAIGVVGATGGVVSSQLHFEIRRKGDTIDPMRHLG